MKPKTTESEPRKSQPGSAAARPGSGFMKPNILVKGRVVRGLVGAGLVLGGVAALTTSWCAALLLFAGGGFVIFEALRGWCVLRACGVKTRF